MSGIGDIKSAFAAAAPGVTLRAVRLSRDDVNKKQILEFDITTADGNQTLTEVLDEGAMTNVMMAAAVRVAEALSAKVTTEGPIAVPVAMNKLVGGDAPILQEPAAGGAATATPFPLPAPQEPESPAGGQQ